MNNENRKRLFIRDIQNNGSGKNTYSIGCYNQFLSRGRVLLSWIAGRAHSFVFISGADNPYSAWRDAMQRLKAHMVA